MHPVVTYPLGTPQSNHGSGVVYSIIISTSFPRLEILGPQICWNNYVNCNKISNLQKNSNLCATKSWVRLVLSTVLIGSVVLTSLVT